MNDFLSYDVGLVVNNVRTRTSFGFSLLCLFVIFGLGCWCVSKWIEIDQLWKAFSGLKASSSPTQADEVHTSDGDNNVKPVAPVASTM